jgi:hypothetical protein
MALSWTAHLLLASPRPACSAAERNPIVQRHVRRIFTLGPYWVRTRRVNSGQQRAGAVTRRSAKLQAAAPTAP